LDDVGHNEAVVCAEELRARGAAVTFVTRHPALGVQLADSLRDAPARRRLFGEHFEVIPYAVLCSVAAGEAVVAGLDSGATRTVAADTVVVVGFPRPRRELASELEGSCEVAVVGDADTPRDLLAAMHDGHFSARAL
jgi:hypothetical protein